MKIMRYLGLIGLAVFLYIVYAIGPGQIAGAFLRLDPVLFALALLALIPSVLAKAYRQCLLVNIFGPRLGLIDSAKIWLIGFFFSVISPGKSGNVIKSFYFKKKPGIPTGKGLSAVVIERFLDVAILFAFVLVSIIGLSFFFTAQADLLAPTVFLFVLFLLLAFVFTKKNIAILFARPFYRHFVPKKYGPRLRGAFHHFFEGVGIYKSKKLLLLEAIGLSVFSWSVAIFQCYLIALSLQINVSFAYLFMVIPIVNLLSILPIAFSGIGTRELSIVFFFGLIGISPGLAVSYSLLVFALDIVAGFAGWLLTFSEKTDIL